ncbi:MAG TPA: hypothetical protein VG073_05215 [Gaiellaceae bacterium]|nr:hypothetical protein [Gaiellaceae bacterium]
MQPRLGAALSATTWAAYRTDVLGVGTDSAAYFSGLGSTSVLVKEQQFPKQAGLTLAGMPGKAMQEATRAAPTKAAATTPSQVKKGAAAQATKASSSQAKRGTSAQAKKGTGKR